MTRNEIVENSASTSQPEKKTNPLEVVHSTHPGLSDAPCLHRRNLGLGIPQILPNIWQLNVDWPLLWHTSFQLSTWSHHSRMHSPDSLHLDIYDMINVSVTLFTDLCPSPSSPAHGQLRVPAPVPGCGGFGDGLCLSQLIFWLSRLMILLWNFQLFYSYPNEPCHRFCCQVWRIPVLPRKYADLANVM